MTYFADTSFFCSLYRREVRTREAISFSDSHPNQIVLSSLIGFEFRQSIRLQIRQNASSNKIGISKGDAVKVLADFQKDLRDGVFRLVMPDWPEVHSAAEILSAKYTESEGHRFADILHVATALQLGCEGFLTFDAEQMKLARHEGLEVIS